MKTSYHPLLVVSLSISVVAVTALAVNGLVELNQAAQVTNELERTESQSQSQKDEARQTVKSDEIAIDEYAIQGSLAGQTLTSGQMHKVATLRFLKELNLSCTKLPADQIDALRGMRLTQLELQGSNVTTPGAAVATMPNLNRLNLADTAVGDATIADMRSCKSLEWLDLHNTKIAGETLSAVAAMPALKLLALSGPQITDADLLRLNASHFLQKLRLYDTVVTAKGIESFLKASSVHTIHFSGKTNLTQSDAQNIEHMFPKCKLVLDSGS
jgi:hypothetical protein